MSDAVEVLSVVTDTLDTSPRARLWLRCHVGEQMHSVDRVLPLLSRVALQGR